MLDSDIPLNAGCLVPIESALRSIFHYLFLPYITLGVQSADHYYAWIEYFPVHDSTHDQSKSPTNHY